MKQSSRIYFAFCMTQHYKLSSLNNLYIYPVFGESFNRFSFVRDFLCPFAALVLCMCVMCVYIFPYYEILELTFRSIVRNAKMNSANYGLNADFMDFNLMHDFGTTAY